MTITDDLTGSRLAHELWQLSYQEVVDSAALHRVAAPSSAFPGVFPYSTDPSGMVDWQVRFQVPDSLSAAQAQDLVAAIAECARQVEILNADRVLSTRWVHTYPVGESGHLMKMTDDEYGHHTYSLGNTHWRLEERTLGEKWSAQGFSFEYLGWFRVAGHRVNGDGDKVTDLVESSDRH